MMSLNSIKRLILLFSFEEINKLLKSIKKQETRATLQGYLYKRFHTSTCTDTDRFCWCWLYSGLLIAERDDLCTVTVLCLSIVLKVHLHMIALVNDSKMRLKAIKQLILLFSFEHNVLEPIILGIVRILTFVFLLL